MFDTAAIAALGRDDRVELQLRNQVAAQEDLQLVGDLTMEASAAAREAVAQQQRLLLR